MLRLSEEQMAILNFYSGTKEEITAELRKAVPFIEDVELKMLSAELLLQIESISNDEFTSIGSKGMLDAYVESRKETTSGVCQVKCVNFFVNFWWSVKPDHLFLT